MSFQNKSYKKLLDESWQAAFAPREKNAPTVISLFAGCGGSSLGYHIAGYHELLAVEWEQHAAMSFRNNFPNVDLYHGDVCKLNLENVFERTKLKPKELFLLDDSPPCQGFSTVGKRQLDDPRNQLFKEYVRLLRGLEPKAFIMENVSGMVKGKMKLIFVEALQELKNSGYQCKAFLMDASQYSVPQKRIRLIIMGIRNDLKIQPSMPNPHNVIVTCANACFGADKKVDKSMSALGKHLWLKTIPGKSSARSLGCVSFFSTLKLHPNKPAPTLCKTNTGNGVASVMHWKEPRVVSIGEAKRLQSFPDQFVLSGKYSDQWARIGNSVPPLLTAAIAKHLREILNAHTT